MWPARAPHRYLLCVVPAGSPARSALDRRSGRQHAYLWAASQGAGYERSGSRKGWQITTSCRDWTRKPPSGYGLAQLQNGGASSGWCGRIAREGETRRLPQRTGADVRGHDAACLSDPGRGHWDGSVAGLLIAVVVVVVVMVAVLAGFAPLAAAAAALALAFGAGPAAFVPDGIGDDFHDLDRCGRVITGDYQVTGSGELLRGVIADDDAQARAGLQSRGEGVVDELPVRVVVPEGDVRHVQLAAPHLGPGGQSALEPWFRSWILAKGLDGNWLRSDLSLAGACICRRVRDTVFMTD